MPFDKETASQAGRKSSRKGVSNKNVDEIRAAFRELTEANMDKVQGWLDQVAAEDPNSALDKFLKLAEYVLPKLARVETTLETKDKKTFYFKEIEEND
jgi:hypothetical protein